MYICAKSANVGVLTVVYGTLITQSRKKPTVQPPSAFVMLPHGGTHLLRRKLGQAALRSQARSTAFAIEIADSDIPSGELPLETVT